MSQAAAAPRRRRPALPAQYPTRVSSDFAKYPLTLYRKDLAEIFGRTVRWVERHVAAGTFPIPRIQWRNELAWRKHDVIVFFEQRTFEATSPTPGASHVAS